MEPSQFFYIDYTIYCKIYSLLFTTNNHLLPHYTSNPLFQQDRWDWQPHCTVGEKYLGCVVCRFHVVSDTGSAPCQRQWHHLWKWFLSPPGSIKPWFRIERKLTGVLLTPFSWGTTQRVLWRKTQHWDTMNKSSFVCLKQCKIWGCHTIRVVDQPT